MIQAGSPHAVRIHELLATYDDPDACVAELLCDRHPPDGTAFTLVEPDHSITVLTYGELRDRSSRFAAVLADLGVDPGDRVATLMGKSADLVVALMGIWRRGAVHVPLFTAFAPSAIAFRCEQSQARVIVTDMGQLHKLAPGSDMPAEPSWHLIVSGAVGEERGANSFDELVAAADPDDPRAHVDAGGGSQEFVRLFTSGTTGNPKGVPVPVRAIASFQAYFEFGLDVRDDDVYFNAADPGWAYGLYYGIIAPLAAGHTSVLVHANFTPELTYWVLQHLAVTNFAAAPTVYRVLRGADAPVPTDLQLQRCSSAGEPLNPEVVAWTEHAFGVPAHDTYGQTEHGMCVINGWHADVASPLRPGSMGHPMPGWCVEVLHQDHDEIAPPGIVGRVVIDVKRSPLWWFTHYVDAKKETAERFSPDGRWYYTGDAASKDDDGYFYFSARSDDVIIMAGYRIGPAEVENVLLAHPEIADAVVVGVPDDLRGEAIEAFVMLRDGATPSAALASELQDLVKTKFAAHAAPRVVHFTSEIPRTPSGKVQRFVLRERRARELSEA